jgi:DNA-binding response OmpR family regulator
MARSRSATVLVLDDDAQIGAFVREVLSGSRYHTVWCPDVEGALRTIADDPPDLALVDIDLGPGPSGWEFLRAIRAEPKFASLPVVMLTGHADTLNRERSLRYGADRYLLKPVTA